MPKITAKPLTAMAVEAAKPGTTRREIPDASVPGLFLIVQPSGSKSWALRYRVAGKARKLTLGGVSSLPSPPQPEPKLGDLLTLSGARKLAISQLDDIAGGADPRRTKRDQQQASDRDLVRNVAAQFIERHLIAQGRRPSYVRDQTRILNGEVIPRWGERSIQEIRKRDVIELLDAVVARGAPVQANRVLATVRKMFNWAAGRDMIAMSPCLHITAPSASRKRDRVLTDDELRWLWAATAGLGHPFGPILRLLILLGQRRAEVCGLRRSELGGGNSREWTIPRERAKNGKPHLVPAPPLAWAILAGAPKVKAARDEPAHHGLRDLLWTTTGKTPPSGFSRAKRAVDVLMLGQARKEAAERGEDPAGVVIPPWRLHDLRRTMATGMQRLKVSRSVVEKVLNHVSGEDAGIVGVYQLYDYRDEKREALEAWAGFILALTAQATNEQRKPDDHGSLTG